MKSMIKILKSQKYDETQGNLEGRSSSANPFRGSAHKGQVKIVMLMMRKKMMMIAMVAMMMLIMIMIMMRKI